MDLSLNLKAMLAQQLIPTPDGKGRRVAMEVLINTPLVSDMIRKAEVHKIKDIMKKSAQHGMKTFDQNLYELYIAGEITYEDAVHYADSANEVRLMIKLGKGDPERFAEAMDGVSVMMDEER
jgi:twitching motility protein PilU